MSFAQLGNKSTNGANVPGPTAWPREVVVLVTLVRVLLLRLGPRGEVGPCVEDNSMAELGRAW